MRLVALVESEDHVCCRYRVAAFRAAFAAAGHPLEIHPLPQSRLRPAAARPRPRLLRRGHPPAQAAAAVGGGPAAPARPAADLRLRRRRVAARLVLREGLRRPKRAAPASARPSRPCDLVVAGNEYLASRSREVHRARARHRHPHLRGRGEVPGAEAACGSRAALLTLVWVGSSSTLRGLERFAPTLSRSAGRCPARG